MPTKDCFVCRPRPCLLKQYLNIPSPQISGKQSQHNLSMLSLPLTDHGGDVAVVVFSHTVVWGTWVWRRDLSPSTKSCWSPPGKDSRGNADASPLPLCSLGCFIFPLAPSLLQHKRTFLYPSIFFLHIFSMSKAGGVRARKGIERFGKKKKSHTGLSLQGTAECINPVSKEGC